MKQKQDKGQKLFDSIYENRAQLLRYFIWVIICSVLRYAVSVLFTLVFSLSAADAELISWVVWSPLFYMALKFFVYKTRSEHIYALLKQITVFILCIFAL